MKAGTFDPYPSHSADPYVVKLANQISSKGAKIFHPPGGPKSRPIESIMTMNVKRYLYVTLVCKLRKIVFEFLIPSK